MEQGKTDIWTLGTTPTITSAFKLLLLEGHSPSIDADPFSSRRCGLGWMYNIQATKADTTQSSSSSTESGKRTMFNISFATPRIATTNLNKLYVTVKATDKASPGAKTSPGASKVITHIPDISLPVSQSIHFASILSLPNFTGNIIVQIIIRMELPGPTTFSTPTFEHAFRGPTPPNLKLHSAVAQSLLGKELGDIKFGLFTRRGGNDVTNPNIIFANSSLFHGHNAFLINLLSDDNMEREVVTVGDLPAQVYSAYDYMSDSDLESDCDPDMDDFGDLDSPSLLGEEFTTHPKNAQSVHRKLEDNEEVILIRDTAFATWKALVFYLYTQEIHFKHLTSSTASHNAEASEHSIACSPKSMYRLATKIEFGELQALSLEAITQDICEKNIIEELFSHFTSMYPEIQKAEVEALIPLLKQPAVVEDLLNKMNVATSGLPHCGAIVAAIMGRVVELAVQG